ncbi:hypothetical protein D3C85_1088660 [compost metagenome]
MWLRPSLMANTSFGNTAVFLFLPRPAMRLPRMARWMRRDSQLSPRPKPKVTKGVWPLAVCRVFTSYSSDWKAS